MIDRSMEIYDWYNNGKQKGKPKPGAISNMKGGDGDKPIWKSSGTGNIPSYAKPSKYQLTNTIKAKINTGLQQDKPTIHPLQ